MNLSKTISERLNAIVSGYQAVEEAQEAMPHPLLSNLSGHRPHAFISVERDKRSSDETKKILDWFLDGGSFVCYSKTERPMFTRKNSKKEETTTWFLMRKKMLQMQIAHQTAEWNFSVSAWEQIGRTWVESTFANGEHALGYYNKGALEYVKSKGATLTEIPCPF